MLVSLTGYKQSGKSTVARYLCEKHGFLETSWAWPLKEYIGRKLFGLDDEILYGDSPKREEIIPKWGMSGRHILQYVGTDLFRNHVDKDFWVKVTEDLIKEKLDKGERIVVSDSRFPNECNKVLDLGGVNVKIIKLGVRKTDLHASETALDNYKNFQYHMVAEHGEIDKLYHLCDKLVEELQSE